jgi:serine protease Do
MSMPTTVSSPALPRLARPLAFAAAACLLAGAALPAAAQSTQTQPTPVPTQAPAPSVRGLPDFTGLVEQVGPAVVNIRTSEKIKVSQGQQRLDPNIAELLRRFGLPVPPQGGPTPPGGGGDDDENAPERRGIGSGFILSADGFVLTNAHVVEGADEVTVTLTDKREFKAKLIGSDQRTDVAVVKIEAGGLPFVKVGDVNRLKVGEWVIAIGSPLGLENTVTAGIVSAKARDTGDYLKLIQTDVAINPGNSGGPLINMRGEVVGINSQLVSYSGGFEGISFAIPIDEAIRVSDQLRATGRVIRGRIGVQIGSVSKEVAESLGLGKPVGALVESVQTGTPAEKAGIAAGDIITKVNGTTVEEPGDLPRLVGAIKPGSKADIEVFRNHQTKTVAVSVIEFEPDKKPGAEAESEAASAPKSALGLRVVDLTDAEKAELRVKGGVKVEAAEGPAARAGLQKDDVILSVSGTDITSAKQFAAVVAKLDKTKQVNMLVRRGDIARYLLLKPSTK